MLLKSPRSLWGKKQVWKFPGLAPPTALFLHRTVHSVKQTTCTVETYFDECNKEKKKRLRIPAVNHVLHRDNPHNVKYKQYISIMWKTQWKDCMQKATWSEQEAGSKYIPSNKAHIWDNKSKISLRLTVLSHSDITQAACPLYESVWTPWQLSSPTDQFLFFRCRL